MTLKMPDFRQFLTHERAVLMACIGIALCFWVLKRLSTSFKKTIVVKLEYVVPQGKAMSVLPPSEVQVMLQGTGWDLLTGAEQSLTINLNNDSIQNIPLRSRMIQKFGNDVIGVSPELMTVLIEEAQTVYLPITAITKIDFVKGYDLADSVELTPSVIGVEGPRSAVERLVSIHTDTLRFEKLKDSVVTKIKLLQNPLFKFNTNEITAKIRAEQFTEKTLFIPIAIKNAPQSLRIFPNKIKLDCTLALSQYGFLDAEKFVAYVDLKNIDLKTKNNTVAIFLEKHPKWVRNIKFSPKSVEFYFEK
jgi:YbbR domain-containing protein